ncbi:class I SAM-dependent methyltransferase [Aphanothece minutissima]|uniref:SAM-dependent methyltransferase n=1 Tax=Aphanothece cf. minutissima CCALA 015 TaxID=2107695 RepID=A0ABX5F5Q1_9CHRO|nr:class I SAM-dependent methyltransferase [Aphanothece minutissima]PSB36671.1 SAM-dependent methyltransferase [Aphanothece cf. minutissima CCALA 015]
MTHHCRHCGTPLEHEVIDLGHQPPSNAYLCEAKLSLPEVTFPLRVYVCSNCWLVQLPMHAPADALFTADYAYFSSTSITWCQHAERFVNAAVDRLSLGSSSLVVEVASNDGYLLQYVKAQGIPCLGIEPTHATAEAARSKGIDTHERFFGGDFAAELVSQGFRADLLVANNVLAHVPDINDFLAAICRVLKPSGVASVEFPHLLRLLDGNQFDTIYHEHYSYLSLTTLQRMAEDAGLMVLDAEQITTHGGSLRVWLARSGDPAAAAQTPQERQAVEGVLAEESTAGLTSLDAYDRCQKRALEAKFALMEYLLAARRSGKRVLAYGAAAKGNTLLNFAGIRSDLLEAVADLAPSKIGKWLPGSHIPIINVNDLLERQPDELLVLPWNLAGEVKAQLRGKIDVPVKVAIPILSAI